MGVQVNNEQVFADKQLVMAIIKCSWYMEVNKKSCKGIELKIDIEILNIWL